MMYLLLVVGSNIQGPTFIIKQLIIMTLFVSVTLNMYVFILVCLLSSEKYIIFGEQLLFLRMMLFKSVWILVNINSKVFINCVLSVLHELHLLLIL